MNAAGSKSTSGDSYTFTDSESSNDNFVLNKAYHRHDERHGGRHHQPWDERKRQHVGRRVLVRLRNGDVDLPR